MALVPVVREIKEAYDAFKEDSEETDKASEGEEREGEGSVPDPPSRQLEDMGYFKSLAGTSSKAEPKLTNEEIASGLDKILCDGLSREVSEQLAGKYDTPSNCLRLTVIPCNQEVYKTVSPPVQKRDAALQRIQGHLVKGLTALSQAFDSVSCPQQVDTECAKKQMADAASLLAHTSHELDIFRRSCFRGEIKEEYNSLCTASYPVSGLLFGDNVADKIKAVNDSLKVTKSARKFHPYPQKQKKKFPFLGSGTPHWKKGGGGAGPAPASQKRKFHKAPPHKKRHQ